MFVAQFAVLFAQREYKTKNESTVRLVLSSYLFLARLPAGNWLIVAEML
jgi:hypothetical protein